MVNKINNNEIETTEGVDTENTSYTENEFKEESQKNRRRFLKPIMKIIITLMKVIQIQMLLNKIYKI